VEFGRLILWIVTAGVFAALILFFGNIIRKKAVRWVNILVFVLKVVAVAILGLFLVYWDTVVSWKYNMLLAGLYVAVFGSVIADALRFALWLFGRKCSEEKIRKFTGRRMEAVVIAALFLYGTLNAMIVTPRFWTVTSEKLDQSYRIVFLSDVHYGSSQPLSVIENMMEDIRKQQPDLLIVGGDVTDEYTTKEEAEDVWKVIGDTGIPTVFVWGNHDRQENADFVGGTSYSIEEITGIIEGNGVRILADAYLPFASDLMLYGREDLMTGESRQEITLLDNPSPGAFLLILDHEQFTGGDIPDTGADLQLSGHSHAGQYVPLRLIYALAGACPDGLYKIGDSKLIVSVGASVWASPFRTEGHCHYEVVDLIPAK